MKFISIVQDLKSKEYFPKIISFKSLEMDSFFSDLKEPKCQNRLLCNPEPSRRLKNTTENVKKGGLKDKINIFSQ